MLDTFGKKVSFIIFLFLLTLWLGGCGVNYHLKKADSHLKKAIAKGASIDTIKKVKYDTVKIESVRDSIVVDTQVDTVRVIEECVDLITAPIEDRPKAIKKLKEQLCPKLVVDTTYEVGIRDTNGKDYILPIKVKVNSDLGYYAISSGQLKIAYKKEETNLTIKPKTNTWRTIAIILGIVLAATIFITVRK